MKRSSSSRTNESFSAKRRILELPSSAPVLIERFAGDGGEEDFALDSDEEKALIKASQLEKVGRISKQIHSTDAQVGIIESVTLKNFMCHTHLKVQLIPKVNFITGHNGSGKSAILAGITICLGGKASATNRATNLKGLIKEGEDRAEIEVKIRNKGPDAFKHEIYGDYITVLRGINKNNSTDYKIKSTDDKIISRNKAELTLICDYTGIQPDNPLLILTQDAAKEFLASSKPEERYKFFLMGSQLQQLNDDYEEALKNATAVKENLNRKKKLLPEVGRQAAEAEARYNRLEASRHLETNLDRLKTHIAWSHVFDAEKDAADAKMVVNEIEKKSLELQKKIYQENSLLDNLKMELADINLKMEDFNREEHLIENERLKTKELLLKADQRKKESYQEEIKLNEEMKKYKNDRDQIQRKIDEERQKDNKFNIVEIKQRKAEELSALEKSFKIHESKISEMELLMLQRKIDPEIETIQAAINSQKQIVSNAEYEIRSAEVEIKKFTQSQNNTITVFGPNMNEIIREIDRLYKSGKFKGSKPVGPIGSHIVLKDSKWAQTIDAAIGPFVPYAFIVEDTSDVRILQEVFEKFYYGQRDRNGKIFSYYEIYVTKYDKNFDHRSGLPPLDRRYRPIIDVLEIKESLVAQTLVTNFSIEGIILVDNREIGEEVMTKSWPKNVVACFDTKAYQIGHRGRGHAAFGLERKASSGGFGALCCADYATLIQMRKQFIHGKQEELALYLDQLKEKDAVFHSLMNEKNNHNTKINSEASLLRSCRSQISKLKAELDSMDDDGHESIIDELINHKISIETQIETCRAQFPSILVARQESVDKCNHLIQAIDSIKKRKLKLREKYQGDLDRRNNITIEISKFEGEKDNFEVSLKKFEERINQATKDYNNQLKIALENREKATRFCNGQILTKEELDFPTTERIEKAIRETRAALVSRNEEIGSVEEALRNLKEKKERFDQIQREVTESKVYHRVTIEAIRTRRAKWEHFRESIATRANVYFGKYLEKRGFSGRLKFEHENLKLYVNIKTSDAQMTTLTQEVSLSSQRVMKQAKDPRSLSGGEKSFSTVCLLLALWDAMACPIRGLDEFDVYMDPVNRTVAMQMLIDSAMENPQTQYILITPQSMNGVEVMGNVKIHRLEDPRKLWAGGQKTLSNFIMN